MNNYIKIFFMCFAFFFFGCGDENVVNSSGTENAIIKIGKNTVANDFLVREFPIKDETKERYVTFKGYAVRDNTLDDDGTIILEVTNSSNNVVCDISVGEFNLFDSNGLQLGFSNGSFSKLIGSSIVTGDTMTTNCLLSREKGYIVGSGFHYNLLTNAIINNATVSFPNFVNKFDGYIQKSSFTLTNSGTIQNLRMFIKNTSQYNLNVIDMFGILLDSSGRPLKVITLTKNGWDTNFYKNTIVAVDSLDIDYDGFSDSLLLNYEITSRVDEQIN